MRGHVFVCKFLIGFWNCLESVFLYNFININFNSKDNTSVNNALHYYVKIDYEICRRGRDRMLDGFTISYAISAHHHYSCEFDSHS